jgi:valyl-tRNA synthetase
MVDLGLWGADGRAADVVRDHDALGRRLARVGEVHLGEAAPKGSATAVVAGAELAVPIADHVDLVAEAERLRRELARVDKDVARVAGKLSNESFLARAPEDIVEGERAKLAASEQERAALTAGLARVEAIGAAR